MPPKKEGSNRQEKVALYVDLQISLQRLAQIRTLIHASSTYATDFSVTEDRLKEILSEKWNDVLKIFLSSRQVPSVVIQLETEFAGTKQRNFVTFVFTQGKWIYITRMHSDLHELGHMRGKLTPVPHDQAVATFDALFHTENATSDVPKDV